MAALLVAACPCAALSADESGLASEAVNALAHPERLILYSLEPTIKPAPEGHALDNFTVLGKTPLVGDEVNVAINAFREAMAHPITMPDGHGHDLVVVATCFEPRHAIAIRSRGHEFDYLLCYTCGSLEVFRDGKLFSEALAGGSPAALNALLSAKGVPLSASQRRE